MIDYALDSAAAHASLALASSESPDHLRACSSSPEARASRSLASQASAHRARPSRHRRSAVGLGVLPAQQHPARPLSGGPATVALGARGRRPPVRLPAPRSPDFGGRPGRLLSPSRCLRVGSRAAQLPGGAALLAGEAQGARVAPREPGGLAQGDEGGAPLTGGAPSGLRCQGSCHGAPKAKDAATAAHLPGDHTCAAEHRAPSGGVDGSDRGRKPARNNPTDLRRAHEGNYPMNEGAKRRPGPSRMPVKVRARPERRRGKVPRGLVPSLSPRTLYGRRGLARIDRKCRKSAVGDEPRKKRGPGRPAKLGPLSAAAKPVLPEHAN